MNFTLPKHRIAPLIILAVISVILCLVLGLFQMNRIYQYSYKEKLDTYDSLTENVVSLIKERITNTYHSLQDSADLVAKTGELNEENIKELLLILEENHNYRDIAIVNTYGEGYNLSGESINVSKDEYFIDASKRNVNASNKITYTKDNIPVITVAAPIINGDIVKGVLVVKINAYIKNLEPYQSEIEEGNQIYVVNEKNSPILFMQEMNISDFNYENTVANGYFREEAEKRIPTFSMKYFYTNSGKREISYIWDRKDIGINQWSVLIGRVNNTSPFTQRILALTNISWVFVSVCMLFLFIIMIIIQRRSNQKIIKVLYLDPVTGGDNWYRFRILVNKLLSGKQTAKNNYAMINFDINRFKAINDAYGYQKGDEVLKEIYHVIKRWSKVGEPFTRYSADQFYILMSFHDESEIGERIYELNDRLHELHYTTAARISFGVYQIKEQQDSVDRIGEFANIAKVNNKNNVESIMSFFDDAAKSRLLEEEKIEKLMNDALHNDEFQVFLQPKYMATGESILGAEALVRWFSNNGNIISPGYFIPVFEKNGFITKLDLYMLKKVCLIIRDWLDKGYKPMPISVNISRLHFANPRLADMICNIVDEYHIPHSLIELELTESAFLQNKQMLIDTVILLRNYGFLVSMDDFGAGYSSLNSLKDLPLDVVKLDGELFHLTNEIDRGLTVIRNTITMAKDLHMKVVAECIETKEQVEYLCKVGCDLIQGYYFAKPMPTDQFEQRYFARQN